MKKRTRWLFEGIAVIFVLVIITYNMIPIFLEAQGNKPEIIVSPPMSPPTPTAIPTPTMRLGEKP